MLGIPISNGPARLALAGEETYGSGVGDDRRTLGLSAELQDYVIASSGGTDPIATELAAATRERFGEAARMNVEQDQGRLLEFLVAALGARHVVEVGTFTGMSALFLARGLPADGRLVCLDLEARYVELGRTFWARAGVEDRIDVRIGPAADSLAAMPTDPPIDLAFIDADKQGYATYLDLVLERLAPSGVVLVDNVLWGGAVLDEHVDDPDTVAIRVFNDRVAADADLDAVMLGIGDGLTLLRRRAP